MDLTKLSQNDKLALIAGAVVAITALLALGDGWGTLMIVSLLAGIGIVAVVLMPMLAPSAKLPAPRGLSLLALGAAATIATAIVAVDWLGYIFDELADFETIIFLLGLVAAIVAAYAGWVAYSKERGSAVPTAAAPPPEAPIAPPEAPTTAG